MNAINTSSSGPPTVEALGQVNTNESSTATTSPTAPFTTLLAALGSTADVAASVGGDTAALATGVNVALTTGADVALPDSYGHTIIGSNQATPDTVVGCGRRRLDPHTISSPALAIGVPLTITAIPLGGPISLTPASAPASSNSSPGTETMSSTAATPRQIADMPMMATPSAGANVPMQAPTITSSLSATTGFMAAQSAITAPMTLPANLPSPPASQSGTASLARMQAPSPLASSLPVAPGGDQPQTLVTGSQHVSIQPTSARATNLTMPTTATPPNTGAASSTIATVTPDITASVTIASASANTSAFAATATMSKATHHSAPDVAFTDGWGATTGAITINGGASVATTPTPVHPAVNTMAQQLVSQATLLHNGQSAEMQLRLRPPDLGDVRVILRRDAAGALSAHLIPATREAGDVLNANLHHLRNALDQHSEGQRAAVSIGQRDVADQRQQQHMNGDHASHEDETPTTNPATAATRGNLTTAQRVGHGSGANTTVDYDA